ncbi:MAG: hypothetical protein GX868_04605 [Actinobacteria bacterium]|nr:hypothetical protein [Actinomycetota bacterium]
MSGRRRRSRLAISGTLLALLGAFIGLSACAFDPTGDASAETLSSAVAEPTSTTAATAPGAAAAVDDPAIDGADHELLGDPRTTHLAQSQTQPQPQPALAQYPGSWPCRSSDSPVDHAARHERFVAALAVSDLPAVSKTRLAAALGGIEESMWLYCEAERRTGVEALLLAAIHFREANNDPTRSIMSGEPLGARSPDTGSIEGGDRIDNALRAANHLRNNAAAFYRVDLAARPTPLEVGFAALAYNRGGMYCRVPGLHSMESPYVAGGLMDITVDMTWPDVGGADGPAAWGEPASVRGKPDRRLGVLAIMRGLGSPTLTQAFSFNTAETVAGCK